MHNINGFNPTLGKYNNELKPSKSSSGKSGKSLSQEGIVEAMETLQNSILVRYVLSLHACELFSSKIQDCSAELIVMLL